MVECVGTLRERRSTLTAPKKLMREKPIPCSLRSTSKLGTLEIQTARVACGPRDAICQTQTPAASGAPATAWRALAGHLLWGSPMKNNPPTSIHTPRAVHLVSVHLDFDDQARPRPTCLVKADRITAQGSLDRNGRY